MNTIFGQKPERRARFQVWFFAILGLHGIFLGLLLIQGCKNPDKEAQAPETAPVETAAATPSNLPPPIVDQPVSNLAASLPPVSPLSPITPPPTQSVATVVPPVAPPVVQPPLPPVSAPLSPAKEYKAVKGDTLTKIARRAHVSMTALLQANPGLEPAKLRVGQTVTLPHGPTESPAAVEATVSAPKATAEGVYTVKRGDTLTKIAKEHRTTVRALRSTNHLKTDQVLVGQKLKLPSGSLAAMKTTTPERPVEAPSMVTSTSLAAPVATSSAEQIPN